MKIIDQSVEILTCPTRDEALQLIELAGRTCYKSECRGDPAGFVASILKRGHLSVIEHCSATLRFVTNRGVTHELVRHRLAAYSQESTRYCNYAKDKFGSELTFIRPVWHMAGEALDLFEDSCHVSELQYFWLLKAGWTPQQAREVLPNALKTEIVMTANFREWLHVLKLRTSPAAHPQIRDLMRSAAMLLETRVPEIFSHV